MVIFYFTGRHCLDDLREPDALKVLPIDDGQFKIYNRGHTEVGDHSKDKNRKLVMPVTFESDLSIPLEYMYLRMLVCRYF